MIGIGNGCEALELSLTEGERRNIEPKLLEVVVEVEWA